MIGRSEGEWNIELPFPETEAYRLAQRPELFRLLNGYVFEVIKVKERKVATSLTAKLIRPPMKAKCRAWQHALRGRAQTDSTAQTVLGFLRQW